ncbi:MAG TPA: phospholipase [Solirubrobacterales bacterium]
MTEPLEHLIREPAGEPEGALVLSHGRGTSEHDLFPLIDELDPERRLVGIAPAAPITGIPPGGKHWYVVRRVGFPDTETFAHSYGALTSFLDSALASRGIPWERTVLGGFSMGAVMSYSVGLGPDRPRPAGILALSGFVPTVEGWQPDLSGRAGLPVMIHHGRADPVIEVGFGRAARDLLEPAGLDVTYLETDAGHWVPPELIDPARGFIADILATEPARDRGGS